MQIAPRPPGLDVLVFFGAGASAPAGFPAVKEFLPRCVKLEPTWRPVLDACLEWLRATRNAPEIESIENCNSERLFTELYHLCGTPAPKHLPTWHGKTPREVLEHLERMTQLIYYDAPYAQGHFLDRQRYEPHVALFMTVLRYCTPPRRCQIVTTNYDCMIEWAFRQHLRRDIHDGFVRGPRGDEFLDFEPDESSPIVLWKIHGSADWLVRWFRDLAGNHVHQVVRRGTEAPVPSSHAGRLVREAVFMVPFGDKGYPNDALRSNSYARLRDALRTSGTWITVGFRFGDPAILEAFSDELSAASAAQRTVHWLIVLRGKDEFLYTPLLFDSLLAHHTDLILLCPVAFAGGSSEMLSDIPLERYCEAILSGHTDSVEWRAMTVLRDEALRRIPLKMDRPALRATPKVNELQRVAVPGPSVLPVAANVVLHRQEDPNALWSAVFVFDSTAISDAGHEYYAGYVRDALVGVLSPVTDCREQRWELHSGNVCAYHGDLFDERARFVFTWERAGLYGADSRLFIGPSEGIAYAVTLGPAPRLVLERAHQALRASQTIGYRGCILFEQSALFEVSYELGLLKFPELVQRWRESALCSWISDQ